MRVLFVADQFDDSPRGPNVGHAGGAELTDRAAIEASPWPVTERRFSDLREDDLDAHDLHVVGNSGSATEEQLRSLSKRARHVLFEHDIRICRWRGNFPAIYEPIHRFGQRCVCPHPEIARLFRTSIGAVFLTHTQRDVYLRNPFYPGCRDAVLGCSLFNRAFFARVDQGGRTPHSEREGWWVTGSPSKSKGSAEAAAYCRARGVEPTVMRGMGPNDVLDALSGARRFVCTPLALESAGRMPVEARLLGAEVTVNEHVGVARESWWATPDEVALEVVRDAPARFWRLVNAMRAAPAST